MPNRMGDAQIAAGLSWVAASHLRAVALLLLLSLACFLPGLSTIPPLDRDETSFVQATRQMLETGNYVDIRLGTEPRYKKPVGIYWLQAAFVKATGHDATAPIWVYRLASLCGAIATVLLTYWTALPLFGRRAAFVAGALMSTSLILTVEAHIAKTDAVQAATILLAMGSLARLYMAPEKRKNLLWPALGFWIGIGLGILVKGPIAPMIAGLTILTIVLIERRYAWLLRLRPLIGVPLMLLIVVPWFAAIVSVAGTDFFTQSVMTDAVGKIAAGQETHSAPPGAHFVMFWFIFWPGTVLVPLAAGWVWQNRDVAAIRFCLAWLVPSWLVFEAVATKLPHYTLPLFPAVAALIGDAVAGDALLMGRWWTRLIALPPAIYGVALAVGAVAAVSYLEGGISLPLIGGALAVLGFAVASVVFSVGHRPVAATALLAIGGIFVYFSVFGLAMPRLDQLFIAPRLAIAAEAASTCGPPQVISAGFYEPSLMIAAGTDTHFADGAEAATLLTGSGCRIAVVSAAEEPAFLASATAHDLAVEKADTVQGFDLGRFGPLSMGVYRLERNVKP